MKLRYGKADENVRKRSIEDVILHERQKYAKGFRYERQFPEMTGGKKGSMLFEGLGTGTVLLHSPLGAELAVLAAVNRLAARKIRAERIFTTLLLPAGTEEEAMRLLIRQACGTVFEHGIEIGEVQAEVTDAVNRPVIYVTAAGMRFHGCISDDPGPAPAVSNDPGPAPAVSNDPGPAPAVSDDPAPVPCITGKKRSSAANEIVLAGTAGMEGTCILATEYFGRLQDRFPASLLSRMKDLRSRLCILETAETAVELERQRGQDLPAMVSPGEGGIFAGLWELAEKTGCGMNVDLQAIPLLQETIEITEYLGIDPYLMRAGGSLLIVCPDGEKLAEELRGKGSDAVKIGALTSGNDRVLINGEETRYLDRPQTDSLTAFCHEQP